jgi:hypothetical protein
MAWRGTLSELSVSARHAVARMCGSMEDDDDDSVNYSQKLMLGEEEDMPRCVPAPLTRAPYVSPAPVTPILGMGPTSCRDAVARPQPSTAPLAAAKAAEASLCSTGSSCSSGELASRTEPAFKASQLLSSSQSSPPTQPSQLSRPMQHTEHPEGMEPAEPQNSQSAQASEAMCPEQPTRPASTVQLVLPLDANVPTDHNSITMPMEAVHSSNLEDIMSAVTKLEEQGRLVEASRLMAKGLGRMDRA